MWRRVLAETALAVAGSGGVCFLLYALLGLSIGGGGVGGVVMIVAPLATPLLVAPLAAYPFARANERIAALLAEVEATRRALADEVAEGIAVQRRLEELARRDPLTGLLNRRGFFERATAAAGKALAVTVVDVDNFKEVNDRYGHAAGDAVLNVIASSPAVPTWRASAATSSSSSPSSTRPFWRRPAPARPARPTAACPGWWSGCRTAPPAR